MTTYKATGVRIPLRAKKGSSASEALPQRGEINFNDKEIDFKQWHIDTKRIKSACYKRIRILIFSYHQLHITDEDYSYTFNLPAKAAKKGFPFPHDTVFDNKIVLNLLLIALFGGIGSVVALI